MVSQRTRLSRRTFLKLTGAVAVGAGSGLLSSCAPAGQPTAAPPAQPTIAQAQPTSTVSFKTKAIDLTFWVIPFWKGRTGKEEGGTETDYYNWSIEEFKKLYPNVNIKVDFIPSTFDGWAKFDTAVASGNPPDTMWGQAGNQWKYAPQEAVEPFDEWMDPAVIADLHDPVKKICKYADGKLYLWPYGEAVAGGVFANTELFEKAGALNLLPTSKERAWTIQQYEKALEATTKEIDGKEVYGTAFMTDWCYQVTQYLYGFGADLYNDDQTKMVVNSPEGVEALTWLGDLERTKKWCAPGSAGRTNDVVLRLFMEQKIAVLPSQPYYITGFRNWPDLKPSFQWMFLQPPYKEGKAAGAEANVHGYMVAKNKDKDKLAMGMEWIKFLTRPEALEIAAWAQGTVPPLKSMLKILAGDSDRYVEGLLASTAKPWGRLYSEIGPKVETPLFDTVFAGSKTPKQAADDAVDAGNKILADAALTWNWPVQ